MDLYPESRVGFEWRVVWFPPDKKHGIFHGTEDQVRQRAEAEAEWNPAVERRSFLLGYWEDGNG